MDAGRVSRSKNPRVESFEGFVLPGVISLLRTNIIIIIISITSITSITIITIITILLLLLIVIIIVIRLGPSPRIRGFCLCKSGVAAQGSKLSEHEANIGATRRDPTPRNNI